jgi:hypothetical protein
MTFCDACETCALCLRKGCIPITPVEVPKDWPAIDETLIPENKPEGEC